MPERNLRIILSKVFKYLILKDLLTCRLVCVLWKKVASNRKLWRSLCRRDYPEICDSAYYKSGEHITWSKLYRSLTLWSKLLQARAEYFVLFRGRPVVNICDFQLIRNGIIAVQLDTQVVYYNIYTLRMLEEPASLHRKFKKYRENEYIMAGLDFDAKLTIIDRETKHEDFDNPLSSDIQLFLLVQKYIYCIKYVNRLCQLRMIDDRLQCDELATISDGVLALSSKNGCIYIMTYYLTIKMWNGTQLKNVRNDRPLFHDLRKYNFFEELDWKTYYHWLSILNKIPRIKSLSEIVIIRSYGKTLFVGYNWGVLCIYRTFKSDDLYRALNQDPVKVYSLMERKVVDVCPIIKIDIVERVDGHILIVAMPTRLVYINYKHF